MFEADKGTTSSCNGACAKVWPPVTTAGAPTAAGGAVSADLGTTMRSDGTEQVTYKGHPLYFFDDDKDSGDAYGQGSKAFGAGWYVLKPSGSEDRRGLQRREGWRLRQLRRQLLRGHERLRRAVAARRRGGVGVKQLGGRSRLAAAAPPGPHLDRDPPLVDGLPVGRQQHVDVAARRVRVRADLVRRAHELDRLLGVLDRGQRHVQLDRDREARGPRS